MRTALIRTALAAAAVGVLCAAMTSCASAKAAGDHAGAAGGAALGGLATLLFGLTGWLGAAVTGVGGWIGGLFFTPRAPAGAPVPGFPWGLVVLVVAAVLVARAWAHYPVIFASIWDASKAAARGLLGGRTSSGTPSDSKK